MSEEKKLNLQARTVHIKVDPDDWNALKHIAIDTDTKSADLVGIAVNEYVKKHINKVKSN